MLLRNEILSQFGRIHRNESDKHCPAQNCAEQRPHQ